MLNIVSIVPAVAVPAPEVPAAAEVVSPEGKGLLRDTHTTVPPPALKASLTFSPEPPAPPE